MPNTLTKVVLMPGDYYVGPASCRMHTLLGSCVSITLWQPQRRIGAMSHFVLCGRSNTGVPNARYAEDALQLMSAELQDLNIRPQDCQAKIFGGGAMFGEPLRSQGPDIGRRNGECARQLLLVHGIPIVSESLFGAGHRQIVFNVRTGDVWVRHAPLPPTNTRPKEDATWASRS